MSDLAAYRTIELVAHTVNDWLPDVYLSAGDDEGRILRFVLYNGSEAVSSTGLSARVELGQQSGLYQAMTAVDGADTATWECALKMGNVEPGTCRMGIRITDSGEHTICHLSFKAIIEADLMTSQEDSEEMQTALSDFQAAAQAAISACDTATAAANTAATNANNAASSATSAITDAVNNIVPGLVADAVEEYAEGLGATTPDSAVHQMVEEEWTPSADTGIPTTAIHEMVLEEWS